MFPFSQFPPYDVASSEIGTRSQSEGTAVQGLVPFGCFLINPENDAVIWVPVQQSFVYLLNNRARRSDSTIGGKFQRILQPVSFLYG